MKKILVGTDTSAAADLAVADAARLARRRRGAGGAPRSLRRVRPRAVDPKKSADPIGTWTTCPSVPRRPRQRRAETGDPAERLVAVAESAGAKRSSSATGARTARGGGSATASRTWCCGTRRAACSSWTREGRSEASGGCSVSRRNASTAITRRCTSVSSVRPSLWNIELMCFSTARSVRNSVFAMAALFIPWAISYSTSRSRSVSWASGEWAIRSLAATRPSTTFGSSTLTTLGDLAERPDHLVDVAHPLLQQVPEPPRAVLQQVVGVLLVGELAQDDDADRGMVGADAPRGAIPSSVPVGGIRMSVRTASGVCS